MIISLRALSYADLKKQIAADDKVVIISCNTCVKACGVGGRQNMSTLEKMLKADGYTVLGKDLISIGCTLNLVERHRQDPKKKEMYEAATVIIPLICEDGLKAVQAVFRDKKVIPIAKTLGTGNFTMERGVVLTHPFESTGLAKNLEGYDLSEVAETLNLYEYFFDEDEAAAQEEEYVTVTINGEQVTALKGQNLLELCLENDINVPHLCYDPELSEAGACRLCLVKIKGRRDLTPSCCTHVEEGMEIITEDEELYNCRRVILELAMSSKHHNCLTCSKGVPTQIGSCDFQSLIRSFGIEKSRYEENKEEVPVDNSSPVIAYDPNKCVLCGRCVRACEEIAGQGNLGFINRGPETVVAAGLNVKMKQSDCAACMACVNVCPTGALTEKVLHFRGKDWKPTKVYCG
ncbi:MAG: 2Fe-2S iron-sulfur cluster-binding protein [Peptococcia bacterium]|jgi:ferredoxin